MRTIFCFIFGHRWVKKNIKFKVNYTEIELDQCVNCGKVKKK